MIIITIWLICGILAFLIDIKSIKKQLNKSELLLNILQSLFLGPLGLILVLYFKIFYKGEK